MVKRKRRLERAIASLKKQIGLHEEKREAALERGKLELADYYDRELASLRTRRLDRTKKRERRQ